MAAPVLTLRTPTGTGSEDLPLKSANGSGANRRRGNQGSREQRIGMSGAPDGRDRQCGGRTKRQSKTKPLLRGKKLAEGGPPVGRGSPFVVIRPGVAPPVGRRWAVVVLRPNIILGLTGTGLLME